MTRRVWTILLAVFAICLTLTAGALTTGRTYFDGAPILPQGHTSVVAVVSEKRGLGNGSWIRSFRSADGTIYLHNHLKSTDGGLTIVPQNDIDVEEITDAPERAVLAKPGLFYALGGRANYQSPGVYRVNAWRSTDELSTLQQETVTIYVPQGPLPRPDLVWYGIYVYRTILELPSGQWLMTMYGNFAEDTLPTQGENAQKEASFMGRSFVVQSSDQGRTWHYLASIAVPRAGDPIGEGFVEPAITRLNDGRLLTVMRTGHEFPFFSSWSSDEGKTWTPPVNTGLDRGCDPTVIRLADGRIALSWGRRSQDKPTWTNLAISDNGGETWINHQIADRTGSGYSTIFEVEPNVLFTQVDEWYWRTTLVPKGSSGGDHSATTVTTTQKAQLFSDLLPSRADYEQITSLAARGVIHGFADGTFLPDGALTRQQFAKMVVLTKGYPVSEADICTFADVEKPGGDLYPDNYIAVLAARGISQGTAPGQFAPWNPISRAQLITMIARTAELETAPDDYLPPFGDFSPTHFTWAKRAAFAGLFNNLQGMGPGYDFWAPATRGEASVLLYNLLESMNGILTEQEG